MRVVLTGASGQLGAYVGETLIEAGHWVIPLDHSLELTDAVATERALAHFDPEVIIHAAALSTADAVRKDRVRAWAVNVEATARLAAWCEQSGRRMLFTSTDLVFDGSKPWNREDDPAEPLLAYGQSKVEAEPYVRAIPDGLVVRLSLLFGPSRSPGRLTYMDRTVSAWKRGEPQAFFEDEFRTPLDLATAARAIVGLAESTTTGLIHVGGRERLSRFELARRVALALGFDRRLVAANRQGDVPSAEPRPADVSLDTERFASLFPDFQRPDVEEAATQLW